MRTAIASKEFTQRSEKAKMMHKAGINIDPIGKVVCVRGLDGCMLTELTVPIQSFSVNLESGDILLSFPIGTRIGVNKKHDIGTEPDKFYLSSNDWVTVRGLMWSFVTLHWTLQMSRQRNVNVHVEFQSSMA